MDYRFTNGQNALSVSERNLSERSYSSKNGLLYKACFNIKMFKVTDAGNSS